MLLLPERAFYWKRRRILILSDLHLGKAGHFRKHGIPVSRRVHLEDLDILHQLIIKHQPAEIILLGDLFHSYENAEWQDFVKFLDTFDQLKFTLVEGNHDILSEYPDSLEVVSELKLDPFSFTHIKQESELYNISGHIHPGIRIHGKARQGLTLPCFWFSAHFAIVPAYGQFTGIKRIKPVPGDKVYAIAGDNIMEIM